MANSSWFFWWYPLRKITKRTQKYSELNADLILQTIKKLEDRIGERFPESGLYKVCIEFNQLACESELLARRLGHPIWWLRIAAWASALLLIGLVFWAFFQLIQYFSFNTDGMHDLLQATESAINELIFLGLSLYFLTGSETRLKRGAALKALHQLRSIAHVVDMHQLTKDPATLLNIKTDTSASPKRSLNRYELGRYLDYCSEMLSLNAKISALFVQYMDDPVVLTAVNELELLIQGLSAKIWQKIMILDLADHKM